MFRLSLVIGSMILSCLAVAQEGARKMPPMRLNFGDVAMVELAKADDTSIAIEMPVSTRSRSLPVTRTRSETRTRTVTVNGKQVQQSYIVQVPYTEVVTQSYTPSSQKNDDQPKTYSLGKISAWDIGGEQVSGEELANSLRSPVAAILLKSPWRKGISIDPSHRALIREDTLFLHIPELSPVRRGTRAIGTPVIRP